MQKTIPILLLCLSCCSLCCKRSSEKPTFLITADAGPNGRIAPNGQTKVTAGTDQTYYIRPEPGYGISSILVDNRAVVIDSIYTFHYVNTNHAIQAVFEKAYTITVKIDANGTVSPSDEITAISGASVLLVLQPAANYHTDTLWLDGIPHDLDGEATFTLDNITTNHKVKVSFTDGLTRKEFAAVKGYIGSGNRHYIKIDDNFDNSNFFPWEEVPLRPCEKDDYEYYGNDGTFISYVGGTSCYPGGPTDYDFKGTWAIDKYGKKLYYANATIKDTVGIELITSDSLVITYKNGLLYRRHYINGKP